MAACDQTSEGSCYVGVWCEFIYSLGTNHCQPQLSATIILLQPLTFEGNKPLWDISQEWSSIWISFRLNFLVKLQWKKSQPSKSSYWRDQAKSNLIYNLSYEIIIVITNVSLNAWKNVDNSDSEQLFGLWRSFRASQMEHQHHCSTDHHYHHDVLQFQSREIFTNDLSVNIFILLCIFQCKWATNARLNLIKMQLLIVQLLTKSLPGQLEVQQ